MYDIIAVHEQSQGKGIGEKVDLDAINRARIEGTKVLNVGIGNSNINQLAFYQKCGFRIAGVEETFLEYIMKKRLWSTA